MGGKMRPIFLFVASVVFCASCGDGSPAVHPVKGKVTKGGAPLAGIDVKFAPVDGGPTSSGRTNESGVFVLTAASGKTGAVAGKHKVTLKESSDSSAAGTGSSGGQPDWAKIAAERDSKMQGGNQGAPPEAEKKEGKIPAEYSDESKTPLPAYEVKAGSNDFDIAIP